MNATPVSKDEVRMLVADLGYQETAQRLNIKPATLRKWAERGKWNTPTRTDQRVTLVTKAPADVHAEALAEDERETRISLSKSARRMAKDAEEIKLRDAEKALTVGKLAGIVHKWDAKTDGKANVMVNVAILGINPDEVTVKGEVIDEAT